MIENKAHFLPCPDGTHPLDLPSDTKSTLNSLIGLPSSETAAEQAASAFLYLYLCLYRTSTPVGLTVCCRSTRSIGAGLGSSASYSVCIATALLVHFGHIPLPGGSDAVKDEYMEMINRWSFKAEQVIHGNP